MPCYLVGTAHQNVQIAINTETVIPDNYVIDGTHLTGSFNGRCVRICLVSNGIPTNFANEGEIISTYLQRTIELEGMWMQRHLLPLQHMPPEQIRDINARVLIFTNTLWKSKL